MGDEKMIGVGYACVGVSANFRFAYGGHHRIGRSAPKSPEGDFILYSVMLSPHRGKWLVENEMQ
jgi:hypothetical protein